MLPGSARNKVRTVKNTSYEWSYYELSGILCVVYKLCLTLTSANETFTDAELNS